jgi:hypothetical protein
MSNVLATFSGKIGDILWSLPTVRELSKRHGSVDFAVMPQYESLLPLLEAQDYIDKAFVIPEWICWGSPHGDQPWEAPVEIYGYEHVYNLTYKAHPGIGAVALPLADFIAYQQELVLQQPVVPFLKMDDVEIRFDERPVVAYGFNELYAEEKSKFLGYMALSLGEAVNLEDVTDLPFSFAAAVIKQAVVYFGCRSACWVIAMGLGVQTITYEPHPNRRAQGRFGKIFGCPYGKEFPLASIDPMNAAGQATAFIHDALALQSAVEVK